MSKLLDGWSAQAPLASDRVRIFWSSVKSGLAGMRREFSNLQAQSHLLKCQRYIELYPVRAGMEMDPAHYRRSIYRSNGLGRPIRG